MTTRRQLPLLACAIMSSFCFAQQEQKLHLIARSAKDSVVLRWAPGSAASWERLNKYGYKVERVAIIDGVQGRPKVEVLSRDTLRPWPLEKWKQRFPEDHPYAPVAAQALYGKTFGPPADPHDIRSVSKSAQVLTLRWTFSLMMAEFDAATATALGLRWVDRDLSPNARYLYRVISLDPSSRDTAITSVDRTSGPDVIPASPTLRADERERSVTLKWESLPLRPPFTAYWIERSADGRSWERLNDRPFMHGKNERADEDLTISYTDTAITKNYAPYHYRLIGITPFGETGAASAELIAMGRDRTPPPDPVMKEVKDEHGKLVVHWEMKDPPRDLKGFRVDKSPGIDGPYHPLHKMLLPANLRSFTDTSRDLLGENHYVVVALDTSGNEARSLPGYGFLVDSIAPAAPTGLSGRIDTNGVVMLHWHLCKERDILGYRVFFANSPDHEFTNRTGVPIADTTFTDTIQLNTLTPRIYYRIVAVDRNYNHSASSAILPLKKPDRVAPVAPVFAKAIVSDTSVVLSFVPSSSADVAEHRLLRRRSDEKEWRRIASWGPQQEWHSYSDRTVEGPAFYSYTIEAVDSAGHVSRANTSADVRVYPRLHQEALHGLRATRIEGKHGAQLTWDKPDRAVTYFVVYRGAEGSAMNAAASVEGSRTQWTDNRNAGTGQLDYGLKAVYTSGAESPIVHCSVRAVAH